MENPKRRRGRKRKQSHFIDVAFDGYIRDQALQRWRAVQDAMAARGLSAGEALREAGAFPEKGAYREIWERWWERQVTGAPPDAAGHPIGQIEAAIRGAIEEEREGRRSRGDPDIEDTLHYKAFVDRAMEHLLEEAGGEIEEWD